MVEVEKMYHKQLGNWLKQYCRLVQLQNCPGDAWSANDNGPASRVTKPGKKWIDKQTAEEAARYRSL